MVPERDADVSSPHRATSSRSTVSLRFNRSVLKARTLTTSGNASRTVGVASRVWLARCFRRTCVVMVKTEMKDVCRLCLMTDDLVWIFDKRLESNDMKDVIYITTGVEVRPSCYFLYKAFSIWLPFRTT